MPDNPAPTGTTATLEQPAGTESNFSWKTQLSQDFANSPTMQKFPDTKEGFNAAIKSHLSLEQMLGKEKVVIPKDEKDTEGWGHLAKAIGVPDKADAYGLPDPEFPEDVKGVALDKSKFQEIALKHKLAPWQAKSLWTEYSGMLRDTYTKAVTEKQTEVQNMVNKLRSEWGDAYETNVELGQMVINKFSSDKDMQDWITSSILSNPNGAKFLSKIGSQFAENKIGEFGFKKFSLTPDQAQTEIDSIVRDQNHPYNNDKLPRAERQRAIDYVNSLYATINRAKGQA